VSRTTGAIVQSRCLRAHLFQRDSRSIRSVAILFFDDQCSGADSQPVDLPDHLTRVTATPSSPTTVVTYAQLPFLANGGMAFAPNGTALAVSGLFRYVNVPRRDGIGPRNVSTVTVTPLTGITSDYGIAIGATNSGRQRPNRSSLTGGHARRSPQFANPSAATVLASVSPGVGVAGPDGCLYSERSRLRSTGSRMRGGFVAASPDEPRTGIKITTCLGVSNPSQGSSETFTATLQNVELTGPTKP